MAVTLNVRSPYSDSDEVMESPFTQSSGSSISYQIDVSNRGDTPTVPTFTVVNKNTLTDVTEQVTTGDATVTDNYIILPALTGLLSNNSYLIKVLYTLDTDTRCSYFEVYVE
jgi:hypothetical protein